MHDEQAFAVGFCIPSRRLYVLQDKVFITVSRIVDYKHIAIVGLRLHIGHQCICSQFFRLYPSAEPALVACIVAGHIAIAIVATTVHQRPVGHTVVVTIFSGIIKVGKSHTMGELMAKGTDAVSIVVSVEFGPTGIGVNLHLLKFQGITRMVTIGRQGRTEVICMRPDGACILSIGLTMTGIHHIDLIHVAVIVPIIVRPFHLFIHQLAGFDNHLMNKLRTAVTGIVLHFLGDSDRSHHIKSEIKLPVALAVEIIMHRTNGAILVSIAHFVGHFRQHLLRILGLKGLGRGFH